SQFQALLLKVAFTRARSEAEMDYGLSFRDNNGFLPSKKIFNRFSLGEKPVQKMSTLPCTHSLLS
ncbi:hypothetical protein, partial [Klebsiella pneumoniae]|uniref:hypothetical protein n=1 Tax=Klebsiella pneumoniae TaxID=573 RepID=UPI001BE05B3B